MGSDRDQELARTATGPVGSGVEPLEPPGSTLGRYRLERELGAGAMGVVHAAFDPDLERRVALKVLRGATATVEAKDRLMREARAMARLTRPNVVTVHEVGTAGGRDFVAMELIHGESLAEWLRAERRPAAAIVEAFIAAGRGLAAAHAAGIVHRDFKPHNVLRSRDGRIVVTDFGLAREADRALGPALDATLPASAVTIALGATGTAGAARAVGAVGALGSVPSSLSGLTVTGALLGTPAYMAPEQWCGGAVTPATDQFAFCVALWEALSGARPYAGPTLDDLRGQVARGPAALDASKIPRRVRGVLRRGLDPAPGQRWPSMDALLARLVRVQRRINAAIALAAFGLVMSAVLIFHPRDRDAPIAAACEPPARDPAMIWSPEVRGELRGATAEARAAVLDTAQWSWRAARGAACSAPPQVRQVQLQCLDGALARLDAVRQGFARAPEAAAEEIQAQLIDPEICRKPTIDAIPRLALGTTPDAIAALALYGRSQTDHPPPEAEILAIAERATAEPCARVIAALAFSAAGHDVPRERAVMSTALGLADQCGDERLRADLLLGWFLYVREWPRIGRNAIDALQRGEAAARRVMQPELAGRIAALRRVIARERGDVAEALRQSEAETAAYAARGLPVRWLRAVIERDQLRLHRSEPADLEAVARDARAMLPIAAAQHQARLAWRLERMMAQIRFALGDVAGGQADLMRLWQTRPANLGTPAPSRVIEGVVVDDRGQPVAGVLVAAARRLISSSAGIGMPGDDDTLRFATTDAAGHFAMRDGPETGAIAAQLADRRSPPVAIADKVKLALEPTRSVTGTVALAGVPHTQVSVMYASSSPSVPLFEGLAPVSPDGAFTLSGMSVGPLRLGAVAAGGIDGSNARIDFQTVPASPRSVSGIALSVDTSTRALDIVLRSAVDAPLPGAELFLMPGKQPFKTVADLLRTRGRGLQHAWGMPVLGGDVPAPIAKLARRDDLIAHVEHVTPGELTVCACGLIASLEDPVVARRFQAHMGELTVGCETIGPDARTATVLVPPQPRFDEK